VLSDQPQSVAIEGWIASVAEAARLEVRDEHRCMELSDSRLRETAKVKLSVRENRILRI
jgi:hypothetical protein